MAGDVPGWLVREIEREHRAHALDEWDRERSDDPAAVQLYVDLYRERNGVTLSLSRPTRRDDRLTISRCQRCRDETERRA